MYYILYSKKSIYFFGVAGFVRVVVIVIIVVIWVRGRRLISSYFPKVSVSVYYLNVLLVV